MRTTDRKERLKEKNLNRIYIVDAMSGKELTTPIIIDTSTRETILLKINNSDFMGIPSFFKINDMVLGQFSTDKPTTEEDCFVQLRTSEDNFKIIKSVLEDYMARFFIQ